MRMPGTESFVTESKSRVKKSAASTVTLTGICRRSFTASLRSISTATTRAACAASCFVSAPRPAPISRKVSSGLGAMISTTLSTHADSRKC